MMSTVRTLPPSFADGTLRIEHYMQHDELHRVLYDAAVQHGAQIRHRAKVVDIDVKHREVILESGERINGDVIVGADGEAGVARKVFLGGPQPGRLMGTALYQ